MTKLILRNYLVEIDIPDGSINNAISYLLELQRTMIAKGYSDLSVETTCNYENNSLELWGSREETDAEYASRLKHEKKMREKNVAIRTKSDKKERAEYERLKKKFGD